MYAVFRKKPQHAAGELGRTAEGGCPTSVRSKKMTRTALPLLVFFAVYALAAQAQTTVPTSGGSCHPGSTLDCTYYLPNGTAEVNMLGNISSNYVPYFYVNGAYCLHPTASADATFYSSGYDFYFVLHQSCSDGRHHFAAYQTMHGHRGQSKYVKSSYSPMGDGSALPVAGPDGPSARSTVTH